MTCPSVPNHQHPLRLTWTFFLAVVLTAGLAHAQEQAPSGDIQVPAHWSPYGAPTSFPEGTQLHIIVRGDTLWDLSNQYFENPFL